MKYFRQIVLVLSIVLASGDMLGQSHGWTVNPGAYSYTGEVVAKIFHGENEVTTGTLGAFSGGTCRGFADALLFPLTNKYVFVLICYSNQVSGETLTFRYYDQATNTFYDIKETVPFVSDMQAGNASSPLSFHTLPLVFDVTGGGSYCQGGSELLPVGLNNSEAGVTYTLFRNGIAQALTVQGTGSAITFGNQPAGTYTVSGTSSGGTVSMSGNAVITEDPLPSQPANFTVSAAVVCPGTENVTYTVPNDPSVTYKWSYSGTGATISGSTNSVTVSYSASATSGILSVAASNSCGEGVARTLAITVEAPPAQPGTFITYTENVCQGASNINYSVPNDPSMTYLWSYSGTGVSINGTGNSVNVSFSSSATSGVLSVQVTNGCGISPARTLSITVNPLPAQPGDFITSSPIVCQGASNVSYRVPNDPTVTYTWNYSGDGAAITGSGNAVTVNYSIAATSGNLSVTASVGSCTSQPRTIAITVNPVPAQPAAFTKSTTAVCQGASGITYEIPNDPTVTYTWSYSGAGVTINGTTNSVTVDYSMTATSGNLSVTATNGCGTSIKRTLAITVNPLPQQPSPFSIATTTVCRGASNVIYTVPNDPTITYLWSYSGTGATINGTSNTVTVNYSATATSGNLSVTPVNGCGQGSPRGIAITVIAIPAKPGAITGVTNQCPGLTGQVYSISDVPDATTYAWSLPSGWVLTSGQGTTSIVVTTALSGGNGNISVASGNSCGMSESTTLAVTVGNEIPGTPGPVSGSATQCPGVSGQVYRIDQVTNASTYTWSVPSGWLITAGQGSASITVTTGGEGQNGNISVTAGNGCGTSSPSVFSVSILSVSTAPSDVLITNNNTCAGTGKTLTVTGGSLGSGATWQWYSGSCSGSLAGTGPVIVVDPPAGTSTSYYVKASGTCNTTACADGIVVVTPMVGTPITPLPSASSICQGSINTTYTTSADNATSYNWTVTGSGNTISGTGSTGTVNWDPDFTGLATISVTANGCNGPSAAASTTVIVRPPPTAFISGTTSVCQNSVSPEITFANPQPLPVTIIYNINGVTNSTINVGADSYSKVPVPTNSIGTFTYNLVRVYYQSAPGCSNNASGSATITVNGAPMPTLISSDAENAFCPGTSVTFTAGGGINYNFRVDGVSVQNGASETYTTSSLTNGQKVDVVVTNSTGCTATSAGITNTVYPSPVASLSSSDADNYFCAGTIVTFTAGGGSLYNFRVGGVTVQDGTSSTYTTGSLTNGQQVDVVVTNTFGCKNTSLSISNFVNPLPFIALTNPPVCSADIKTYSLAVAVSSGIVTSTSGKVTNTSGNIWAITDISSGTNITLTVTDVNGCTNSMSVTAPNCLCPVILPPVSGGDKSYCQSGVVPAISAAVLAGETVDWYSSGLGGSLLQASSLTYTPSGPGTYYAMARNIITSCTSSTRTPVTVTMNPLPAPTLSSSDADNIFCTGTNVTFTAGGGTNYNFRVDGKSVQSGESATYTTASLTNGQVVDVIVTNSNGCVATSSEITNTVNALPVASLISSDADNRFCAGTNVVFSAGGGTNYNFRVGGVSLQNGPSSTYSTTSLTNGQAVDVIVTNSNGCAAISPGITNTVYPIPVVTLVSSDPDNSFCAGTSVTFTASGGTNYNFRIDGVSKQNGPSSSFTTNSLTMGQSVDVIVTNANGCTARSAGIINIVNDLPSASLSSSDADNVFCAGTSITFKASGGTAYNFRVGGVSVQDGVSDTFTSSTLTNGQVVSVIVTDANGCSSVSTGITNTVNALPVPLLTSSDVDNRFCEGTSVTFTAGGGTSYIFRVDGISVQSGASASFTTKLLKNNQKVDVVVTNVKGCSAVSAAITNTVFSLPNPTLVSSDADNIFCSGTNITFTAGGGTGYNFRVDGVSVQNGASATYSSSSLKNGQVVNVIVTNSNGCVAPSTGILNTVHEMPAANAGPGGSECDLNYNFKAVTSIGAGTWTKTTGPGDATFTPNANTPAATVTVTAYGTYTFTWTEINGTCKNSSVITVNFYQQPVANAGTGGNNCGNEFYLKAVPSVGTGTWTKTSGPGTATFVPDANAPNALVRVSKFGSYKFTWTEVNGTCSKSATVTVNFVEVPAADAGSGGRECDLDFQFSAKPGIGIGTWSRLSGPGNVVFRPDANDPAATVTVDEAGDYEFMWTQVSTTCSSSDVVAVSFHNPPTVEAGQDIDLCEMDSIQLHAVGTGFFQWSPAESINDPEIADPKVSPKTSTMFKVILTDQFGCSNTDSVKVEVWKPPVADAGPDQSLEYSFETTLDAKQGDDESGLWSVVSGSGSFVNAADPLTIYKGLFPGTNILKWTVTNSVCPPASDEVIIVVKDLVIPTLVTPNMDGKNDYFEIRGIETFGTTQIVIFNRRGTQIYKSTDYDNDWNGLDDNGQPVPEDTYFYVVTPRNGNPFNGYIVIRR